MMSCMQLIKVSDLFTGIFDVVSGLWQCCGNRCARELGGDECACVPLNSLGSWDVATEIFMVILGSTEKQELGWKTEHSGSAQNLVS